MTDSSCRCNDKPSGHIDGQTKNHNSLVSCPKFTSIPQKLSKNVAIKEDSIKAQTNDEQTTPPDPNDINIYDNYSIKDYDLRLFNIALRNSLKRGHVEAQLHLDYSTKSKIACHPEKEKCQVNYSLIPNFEYRLEYCIFGDYKLKTLSASNYPPNILCQPIVYVCEFCLDYMTHLEAYKLHLGRCQYNFNFGKIVYSKDKFKIYEIDGAQFPNYSNRLCLLSKLFLSQKTVFSIDDVTDFIFYVLTKKDENLQQMIGYFSKQKLHETVSSQSKSESNSSKHVYNNLSCILTLPQYQNQGFGRMMIEFSYHLSFIDGKIGSPERPLSDSGLVLYRKHWSWYVLDYLIKYEADSLSLKTVSNATGIHPRDIASTLLSLRLLIRYNGKYHLIKDKELYQEKFKKLGKPRPDRRIDSKYIINTL